MNYSCISYCGLSCENCPIHWATVENNADVKKRMRLRIARMCNELYSMNLTSEDISDCDGCKSGTGVLYSGCANCKIRSCATEKELNNCAECIEYPCQELKRHFVSEPNSRIILEVLKSIL